MSRILPERANLEHLSKQAKDCLRDARRGDVIARERLRAFGPPGAAEHPKLSDAQHALAREYGFTSWARLKAHVESLTAADPIEALAAAVKTGKTAPVAEVLKRFPALKARLNEPLLGGAFGATPLIVAVQFANRELIDLLLAAGADINQRSHWWAGGFHVLDDDHGLASFLIERGATLDANSAARLGMLEELKRLVAANRDVVHTRGGDGQTPLHVAATVEIAQFLLEHGAEIDARDVDHESTPAQYQVRSRQEVARYLVARGARTDILMASALGDLGRVRQLLDADPASIRTTVSEVYFPKQDPRAGGPIYTWTLGGAKTAHTVAREFEHEDVFQLLMDRSPDELKLALACELGDEATFRALLQRRPDLAQTLTDDDQRKLNFAAQNNNTDAVRLMLAAGWPVDARGQHGATALHWAAFQGNAAMAREILKYHPPLEAKEKDYGMTPIGWATYGSVNGWHPEKGDYAGVVEALLDAGAKAPELSDDLEASPAVLEVLRRRAGVR